MSTSGKDPVRGLPQTDEESSRSYFSLSKHHRLTLPPLLPHFKKRNFTNEPSSRMKPLSNVETELRGRFGACEHLSLTIVLFENRDRRLNRIDRGILEEDIRWWSWIPTEEPWKYVITIMTPSLDFLGDIYLPVFRKLMCLHLAVGVE